MFRLELLVDMYYRRFWAQICGLKRCELIMGIDLNRASKMAAFSLIAGAAQNFTIFGN